MQCEFDVGTQIAFSRLIFYSNVNIEYNVCAIYGHFNDEKPVKRFQLHIRMRTANFIYEMFTRKCTCNKSFYSNCDILPN